MIHGCIYSKQTASGEERDDANYSFGMSIVGSEHSELPTILSAADNSYELKQIHYSKSAKNMTSATIGNCANRSVLSTHMRNCAGSRCHCAVVAAHFLKRTDNEQLENYLRENEEFLRLNVECPYLFVITQDSKALCVSSAFPEDYRREWLTDGCYSIKDCSIWPMESMLAPNTAATVVEGVIVTAQQALPAALVRWQSAPEETTALAHAVTAALKQNFTGYPLHNTVAAVGITLLKTSANVTLLSTKHHPTAAGDGVTTVDSNGGNEDTAVGSKRKAAGKTVKPSKKSASVPKNPVSAWNHYVSAIRPTVNTDQRTLTEKDWMKELGRIWNSMSAVERLPFESMAAQDKLRHAGECAAAGVSSTAKKRLTAYNLFVKLERLFVKGTNVDNVKDRLPTHCGLRWKGMRAQEKRLYELLELHEEQQQLEDRAQSGDNVGTHK